MPREVVRGALGGDAKSRVVLSTWIDRFAGLPTAEELKPLVAKIEEQGTVKRELLRDLEYQLRRDNVLGPPPWRGQRFQVFASLVERAPLIRFGRDLLPHASAEASLDWLSAMVGKSLEGSQKAEALLALTEYEYWRLEQIAKIFQRVKTITREAVSDDGVMAILIRDHQLFVFRPGDVAELDRVIERTSSIMRDIGQKAEDLARAGFR